MTKISDAMTKAELVEAGQALQDTVAELEGEVENYKAALAEAEASIPEAPPDTRTAGQRLIADVDSVVQRVQSSRFGRVNMLRAWANQWGSNRAEAVGHIGRIEAREPGA